MTNTDTKYHLIRFYGRKNKGETSTVRVSLGGNIKEFLRQCVVVIDSHYLEIIEHATEPTYEENPETKRKVRGADTLRYPYEIVAEDIGLAAHKHFVSLLTNKDNKNMTLAEARTILKELKDEVTKIKK